MINRLAPAWGGLLLFPEQRYYGTSLPFGAESFSAGNIKFLSTSQVLEDYAALVSHLKRSLPGASNCPVVAFGGSYGGTLAALLRASHPETVVGSLAASSELGYYDLAGWAEHDVTEFSFEEIVLRDYQLADSSCPTALQAVISALDKLPAQEVAQGLHLCSSAALKPRQSSMFVYALEGLPQMDYPYQIGAMPASPVKRVCEIALSRSVANSGHALQAAAAVTDMFFGYDGRHCVESPGVGGLGNTPGDGPGPDSWGYQSCTETLHSFSARGFRSYNFSFEGSVALCAQLFNHTVKPETDKLAVEFGGYGLAEGTAGVRNLIWSHGTLDPWHGWFRNIKPPRAGVHHFLMEGAAHHLDLRAPNKADPPAVTMARLGLAAAHARHGR